MLLAATALERKYLKEKILQRTYAKNASRTILGDIAPNSFVISGSKIKVTILQAHDALQLS